MVFQIDFKCIMVASTTNSTLSRLWVQQQQGSAGIEAKGLCWILEDGPRKIKVPKETRIPTGRFRVRPTRNSKFYPQYKADKILRAKYVLTLEEVPDFSLIRVHAGLDVGDTDGCPLTGLGTGMDTQSNFTVSRSKEALKRLHNICDPYFDEKKMDFSIPVYWHASRTPLIDLHDHYRYNP